MLIKGLGFSVLALMTASVLAGRTGQYGEGTLTAVMHVSQPIVVSSVRSLDFGEVVSGSAQDVVVQASDADASIFSAKGEPGAQVVAGMVAEKLTMTNAKTNDNITVDTWNYGGDIGKQNLATFDKTGALSNLRVGGTAHVAANVAGGDYSGTGKFRLTYV